MNYEAPTKLYQDIGDYLQEELPTEKEPLSAHLRGLEALRYRLAESVTTWHMTLAQKRAQALPPKEKQFTELDRKTFMEGSVAQVQRDYELLKKLDTIIAERLELGQLLFKDL